MKQTALNELIEIIKQKRKESEISNTLLRFVYDEAIRLLETESIEFICMCPSGLKYTKSHKEEMKEWRKIVMNYLKIERLYKNINE